MKKLDVLALVLVIVGALNWGLVALFGFDLVATVFGMDFGETSSISGVVYGLVAASGIFLALRIPALTRQPARASA